MTQKYASRSWRDRGVGCGSSRNRDQSLHKDVSIVLRHPFGRFGVEAADTRRVDTDIQESGEKKPTAA